MKDTGHVETCPFDELLRRHRQAEYVLMDAVDRELSNAELRAAEAHERQYRHERLRRELQRHP